MSLQPAAAVTRQDLGLTIDEFSLRMDREGFIAHRVLPFLPRNNPEGSYPQRTLESILRDEPTVRTADGNYSRSSSNWAQSTYATAERAHEVTIDDRTVRRYDDILDAEFFETERAIDIVLRSYEVAAAAAVFNATTFASYTTAVGTEWSDRDNSIPITNIDTAREAIVTAFGREPNALVCNALVFRNLMNNAQIIDRIKAQNYQDVRPGNVTEAMVAASLDLDRIIVSRSIRNTANQAKTRSLSRIWSSEYAMLCCVATGNDPSEGCIGRTVIWSEESGHGEGEPGVIVEQYREEQRRGDAIRARTDDQIKIVFAAAGHLLSNITA